MGVATVIEHPDSSWVGRHLIVGRTAVEGDLGSERANHAVGDDTQGLLAAGRTGILTYGADGERLDTGMRVFFASYAPPPRMLVFGAIDFASALARLGAFLGYRVTVCDARPVFATPARFPDAAEVVNAWPHRYLASSLPKDWWMPAHGAVRPHPRSEVRYPASWRWPCAAARSPSSAPWDRGARTRTGWPGCGEAGLSEAELSRLHSPVGLDLGARTPEETAVSIAAEFIAQQWSGSGEPLRQLGERIHHDEQQ